MTALDRFVGTAFGTQQSVNRQVEEAMSAYRGEKTAHPVREIPPQKITVT